MVQTRRSAAAGSTAVISDKQHNAVITTTSERPIKLPLPKANSPNMNKKSKTKIDKNSSSRRQTITSGTMNTKCDQKNRTSAMNTNKLPPRAPAMTGPDNDNINNNDNENMNTNNQSIKNNSNRVLRRSPSYNSITESRSSSSSIKRSNSDIGYTSNNTKEESHFLKGINFDSCQDLLSIPDPPTPNSIERDHENQSFIMISSSSSVSSKNDEREQSRSSRRKSLPSPSFIQLEHQQQTSSSSTNAPQHVLVDDCNKMPLFDRTNNPLNHSDKLQSSVVELAIKDNDSNLFFSSNNKTATNTIKVNGIHNIDMPPITNIHHEEHRANKSDRKRQSLCHIPSPILSSSDTAKVQKKEFEMKQQQQKNQRGASQHDNVNDNVKNDNANRQKCVQTVTDAAPRPPTSAIISSTVTSTTLSQQKLEFDMDQSPENINREMKIRRKKRQSILLPSDIQAMAEDPESKEFAQELNKESKTQVPAAISAPAAATATTCNDNSKNTSPRKCGLADMRKLVREYCSFSPSSREKSKHAKSIYKLTGYPLIVSMPQAATTTSDTAVAGGSQTAKSQNRSRSKLISRIGPVMAQMEIRKDDDARAVRRYTGCRSEKTRSGKFRYYHDKSNIKVAWVAYQERYMQMIRSQQSARAKLWLHRLKKLEYYESQAAVSSTAQPTRRNLEEEAKPSPCKRPRNEDGRNPTNSRHLYQPDPKQDVNVQSSYNNKQAQDMEENAIARQGYLATKNRRKSELHKPYPMHEESESESPRKKIRTDRSTEDNRTSQADRGDQKNQCFGKTQGQGLFSPHREKISYNDESKTSRIYRKETNAEKSQMASNTYITSQSKQDHGVTSPSKRAAYTNERNIDENKIMHAYREEIKTQNYTSSSRVVLSKPVQQTHEKRTPVKESASQQVHEETKATSSIILSSEKLVDCNKKNNHDCNVDEITLLQAVREGAKSRKGQLCTDLSSKFDLELQSPRKKSTCVDIIVKENGTESSIEENAKMKEYHEEIVTKSQQGLNIQGVNKAPKGNINEIHFHGGSTTSTSSESLKQSPVVDAVTTCANRQQQKSDSIEQKNDNDSEFDKRDGIGKSKEDLVLPFPSRDEESSDPEIAHSEQKLWKAIDTALEVYSTEVVAIRKKRKLGIPPASRAEITNSNLIRSTRSVS